MRATFTRLTLLACLFSPFVYSQPLPPVAPSGEALPSLAPMLERINPSVVNIATYSTQQAQNNPLLNDPAFRRFFNIPEQRAKRRQQSAGSGVIVSNQAGTVVTNFHVIKGAEDIQVILTDGRQFKAKLLGADPEVDIAVLKIDAPNLTEIPLANSDKLRVGDYVVAIGNPFGLGQTVTTGVVSALGRTGLGIEGYEDFIQTDASINPGNSGGALVNLRGELIGINTAILAPSGGNIGIGFAIPINMAKNSIEQIVHHGSVKRGQIGVSIQDITPELQQAFNLNNGQKGVLITGVGEASEAEKSGLKPGDVITTVEGKDTHTAGQLRSQIGARSPGEALSIKVLREGREKTFNVRIGQTQGLAAVKGGKWLEGVQLQKSPGGRGLVVQAINPDASALNDGLREGDIIVGANRQTVDSLAQLQQALQKDKDRALLHIYRDGGQFFLVLQPE